MRKRFLLAALAAGTLAAAPASGQVDSIRACYVPTTGNVYRIGTPDTHSDCVSPSHVRFAWATPDLGIGGGYLLRLRSGSPPTPRFAVDSAGGVVAFGQLGVGTIPATGPGYRMMWYPFKSAFRAGSAQGTEWDDANIGFFSWAGGNASKASQFGAFAFGDGMNVSGVAAAGFGSSNIVSGTVGFSTGAASRCTGFACVAMGYTTNASGQGSVALGYRLTANADYATALGYRASANGHEGVFVRGDASTTDSILAVANNEFAVRASGGYRLFTNSTLTTGVSLSSGGSSWNVVSDRARKENFLAVDGEDVLARIRQIPVQTWNYIAEGRQVRHMGPMAQDWHAAWHFNGDDKTINSGDFDGVNFAAVKALEARTAQLQAKQVEVDRLNAEVAALRQRVEASDARQAATDARLADLEAIVRRLTTQQH